MSSWRSKEAVEAFRWTGGPDQTEDPDWIVAAIKNGDVVFRNSGTPDVQLRVTNLAGVWTYVRPGNWIIREHDYPDRFSHLDDATFHARYEATS